MDITLIELIRNHTDMIKYMLDIGNINILNRNQYYSRAYNCVQSLHTVCPQLMHLFFCMAKQQINPIGKKQMPQHTPQQVNFFVICPVWHLGQFPCRMITTLGAFNPFWVVIGGGLLIILEKRLEIFVFANLFQMAVTISSIRNLTEP